MIDPHDLIQKIARCWKGYEPVPGKKPYSEDSCRPVGSKKKKKEKKADTACSCGCGDTVKTCKCGPECKCRKPGGSCYKGEKQAGSPAWQRAEGKNDEGGLNAKGRASYNKATGGNLKAPVTESNPKGDRAKRQNSFCSRMCGMKKHETGAKTKKDPDSRINKSLRKWNCKCSSAMEFGIKLAQLQKDAAGARCRGGVCAPAPVQPLQYSKQPWSRDYMKATWQQHGLPFNDKATDQQLYNQYTRIGTIAPGTPENKIRPVQRTLQEYHGNLPPRPLQPAGFNTGSASTPAGTGNSGPATPSALASGASVPVTPQPGVQPSGQTAAVPPQMPVQPAQRVL